MEEYIKCQICGVSLKELTQHIKKKHNISKKEYQKKFPGWSLVSEQTRKNKATLTGTKRPDQSEFMKKNNPTKGRIRTENEKELMSKNRKGKGIGVVGKYKRTPEIRLKISKAVSELYVNGKTNFFTGHYTSTKTMKKYYYRSSWELTVMKYLDFNDHVIDWKYEPFYIPYTDENGDKRNYIPDFLVNLSCNITELWEIKPKSLLDEINLASKRNLCKLKSLNKFVDKNDMNGFIINEDVLKSLKKYMDGIDEKIF